MGKKKSLKRKFHTQVFPMVVFVLLVIYVISFLTPFIWALITSLKTVDNFNMDKFGIPDKFVFENYPYVLDKINVRVFVEGRGYKRVGFFTLIFNSLVYALTCTGVTVITHAIPAYITAKYPKRLVSKFMYFAVILAMLLPIVGNLASELQVMRTFGLYDNLPGMWFMKAGFLGTNFLIFYASFRSISWEYAEAAFIDGASHTGVMLKLMLPLASVTMSAVAILAFIEFWNDWRVNVVYMPSFPLISYALYQFQNNPLNEISQVPRKLAGCMMVTTPIFLMFIIFRKKLMGNITIGGLKG